MKRTIFLFAVCLLSSTFMQAQHSLSGQFLSINGDPLGDLELELVDDNGELINTYTVDCDGNYSFSNLENNIEYTLNIEKEAHALNGSSTFDLVLMSKHILGVQALNDYAVFSGDVNDSGSLTVMDMIILKMLILNINSDLPEGVPYWQFFKEGILEPNNSFSVQINENTSNYNFVGTKKGDVNASAVICE